MSKIILIPEDKHGVQKRKAAVVIGRFQPPTIGHYAVFDEVKKYIRDNESLRLDPIPVVVIIAGKKSSKDKSKNPLTADERMSFMKASGKADGIKFLIAESAFKAFEEVRKAGFEPIAVAAGSDRADNYLGMLDKYFNADDGKDIDHYAIEIERDDQEKDHKRESVSQILQYMDEEIPVYLVSASLARAAVKEDELEKFSIITGLTEKPKLAHKLFNKLKTAMEGNDESEQPDS